MSTFQAPTFQQSQYVSGIPLDLVIQVGSMKQQQYNQAQQAIQGQLDMYGSQDIIKDSDKAVINQKLNSTVENLNKYSSQNLTDPRVQNELLSITGQLNDPDIVNRISANKKARLSLSNLEDIKKNKPELYNSSNEKVFMDQFNQWYNDPNSTQFNASYTPYFDVTKASRDLIDPILKNPDIRRDIEYYKDANGITRSRGESEVKEITRGKIMQALQALPEGAIKQLQIDYQAGKSNLTVDGALQGLDNQAITTKQNIQDIQERLTNPNILLGTKKAYKDQLDSLINQLNSIQETANNVAVSKDPSLYYKPSTYINDRLFAIADTNSFKQQGKLEYDDIFKMDYKFEQDKALKALDAQYAQELERTKLSAKGLGANGLGSDIQDDDVDQIVNIIGNKKGTLRTDQALSLLNGIGKINDDGSAQMNLAGRKLYLDITPTLQASGINIKDETQAAAYQDASNEYNKWIKTTEGQVNNGNAALNSKGEKIINPRTGLIINEQGEAVKSVPRSFDEFLKTNKGKSILDNSNKLGLDLTDPTNITNIKKYINNPQVNAINELFGKGLDNLVGVGNFTPFRQDNVIADKNGDMYTKGTIRMSRADWITKLNGITDNKGTKLWNKLVDDGYIKYTQGEAGKDDAIAELTVTTPLDRDLNSYYDQRVRERFSGDKAAAETIPVYKQNAAAKFSAAREFNRTIDTRDIPTLVGRAQANISANMNDLGVNEQSAIQTAIQVSRQIAEDPNIPWSKRMEGYKALDKAAKMTKQELLGGGFGGNVQIPTGIELPSEKQVKAFQDIPPDIKGYILDSSDKYGVPPNILQGLIYKESGYNSKAISPKGAKGLAQFMDDTAKQYGVNVSDSKSSVEGAAKYLADLYTQFKDWNLALAAYNAGPNRASLRQGKIPNIPETQQYVALVNAYANTIK